MGLDNRDWIGVGVLCVAGLLLAIFVPGAWIGVAGLIVTIVGLAIAVGQIRLARQQITRAVEVSEATRAAITRTRAVVSRNLLIESLGQMQRIDGEMFTSVSNGESREQLAVHLAAWRDAAYTSVALIEGLPHMKELRDELVATAKSAANLRDNLPDDVAQLAAKTKRLRSDISSACGLLAIAKTSLKLDTEQETT